MRRRTSARSRTPSPERGASTFETTKGRYEVQQKLRPKEAKRIESAATRRVEDTIRQTAAGLHVPQKAGRPRKGEEGPKPGSLRAIEATGFVGKDALQRAVLQLAVKGKVRDQRRHNGTMAILSEVQLEAVVQLMYDDFKLHKHVDAAKVKRFAKFVQTDETIASACDADVISEEDAWEPSDAWVTQTCARFRITSHKTQSRPSSRDRPTMLR